jgi:CBS domain-containing protein
MSRVNLMIGVLTTELQREAVREFFQLFKIPWSFCDESNATSFSAVVTTVPGAPLPKASLLICSGPAESAVDAHLTLIPLPGSEVLTYADMRFRVHTRLAAFAGTDHNSRVIVTNDAGQAVGIVTQHDGMKVLRLGYDLFAEVDHLRSTGQAPADALSPAIDIHISILRDALLDSGITVVEIPPHPHGHEFIVCLTHDIDFIGIRHHKLDHTFFGFVYRVCRSLFRARLYGWRTVARNFRALASLPAVYLKMIPDFWYPMDRYSEIEGHRPSTYFFIPYAGRPGRNATTGRAFLRAAPYDVNEYAGALQRLEEQGREVGVHGIDAWCDAPTGADELSVIRAITQRKDIGIRMHWLYFTDGSPKTLEETGYLYDSTLGYNDAVGFRNGTTQVFQPKGVSRLLEVPLNVQDTAMFFPDRMNLGEGAAFALCRKLIAHLVRFGGVLTVNWHDRSLVPERNWDQFYIKFVKALTDLNPWFAQMRSVTEWFQRRRDIAFDSVEILPDRIVIRSRNGEPSEASTTDQLPLPCFRVLLPPRGRPPIEVPLDGSGLASVDLPHRLG